MTVAKVMSVWKVKMKPTVGRIVHYVCNGYHLAAIIVWVDNYGLANLVVFNRDGQSDTRILAQQDETGKSENTWHWPERDE